MLPHATAAPHSIFRLWRYHCAVEAAGLLTAVGRTHHQERTMSQTVAGQLVGVLEQIGVKQIFGLIGDSLNPLADEVRRSQIEWIGVRHEEGAALAAAGRQAHRAPRGLRRHHRPGQQSSGRGAL